MRYANEMTSRWWYTTLSPIDFWFIAINCYDGDRITLCTFIHRLLIIYCWFFPMFFFVRVCGDMQMSYADELCKWGPLLLVLIDGIAGDHCYLIHFAPIQLSLALIIHRRNHEWHYNWLISLIPTTIIINLFAAMINRWIKYKWLLIVTFIWYSIDDSALMAYNGPVQCVTRLLRTPLSVFH